MTDGVKTETNEYELQRQANIAKNQALLKELKLNAAKQGLGISAKSVTNAQPKSKLSKSHKKKAPAKKAVEENIPRRTSSRLAGLTADSEVAKRKAEEEHAAIQEAAKAKRQRVSGTLDLTDIVVAGKQWDKSENFLVDVSRGKRFERTFTEKDVRETTDVDLRDLREKMSGLGLYEGFEPNNKALIFAGDKMGNLGIFDASQSSPEEKLEGDDEAEEPEPAITAFKLHSRTISAFQFDPTNSNFLYSASYDSSIRKLDLAKGIAVEVYAPPQGRDDPLSGAEIASTDPHTLYFSTLEGQFGRYDMRDSKSLDIYQLSEKKIGGFSLHPRLPHLVATASLDRTLKIWDLRKVTGKGDERAPALLGEHHSSLSVSCALWNQHGGLATTSYDNTIKIYDFPNVDSWAPGQEIGEAAMEPAVEVPHNNQTGRWVTILRAQWQQSPQNGVDRFCIGNMNRFVDIYTAKGEQLAQLGGEAITAVPAVAQFHPTQDWVAGGTASGKLCLWM
ncbi:hypothetical protein FGG08_004901 [Glutinoglossum americanum]|uniref:DNA damage-binding protein CMR1 n=1 Tax=Glutinoglossum americanum TaxID=1670608 RepID=A0A9P8L3F8_9PEZI|nr:hypothetical protein FGG08_004901 [Glutinoglossum americanum]